VFSTGGRHQNVGGDQGLPGELRDGSEITGSSAYSSSSGFARLHAACRQVEVTFRYRRQRHFLNVTAKDRATNNDQ